MPFGVLENYSNAIRAYREFMTSVGAALTELGEQSPDWVAPLMREIRSDHPQADLSAVAEYLINMADRAKALQESMDGGRTTGFLEEEASLEGETAAALVHFMRR